MSSRLPSLTAREVIKLLDGKGFVKVRQSGSHAIFRHPDGRRTTVPIHKKRDLGRGLLRQIMKDAEISIEEVLKNK